MPSPGRRKKIIIAIIYLIIQSYCASSQRFSFDWSATLNSATGKAFSMEVSTLPTPALTGEQRISNLLDLRNFFLNYPHWMCNWKIFGGLFRSKSNEGSDGEVSICDTFFGCHLLRFGKPRNFRSSASRGKQVGIEIPIVGGLLARKPGGCLRFSFAQNTCTLRTEIDSYSPWIVGDTLPISRLRRNFYLNSQSFFHAYVLWRFHRDCFFLVKSNNNNF